MNPLKPLFMQISLNFHTQLILSLHSSSLISLHHLELQILNFHIFL